MGIYRLVESGYLNVRQEDAGLATSMGEMLVMIKLGRRTIAKLMESLNKEKIPGH